MRESSWTGLMSWPKTKCSILIDADGKTDERRRREML